MGTGFWSLGLPGLRTDRRSVGLPGLRTDLRSVGLLVRGRISGPWGSWSADGPPVRGRNPGWPVVPRFILRPGSGPSNSGSWRTRGQAGRPVLLDYAEPFGYYGEALGVYVPRLELGI